MTVSSIYQQHLQLIENRTSVLETDTYYGNVIHEINYDVVANDAVAITKDWMKRFAEWCNDECYRFNQDTGVWENAFESTEKSSEQLLEMFLKKQEEEQ